MSHFVSASCQGETCRCGARAPATHKIGEEIPFDEPCYACGLTWKYDGIPSEDALACSSCRAVYHMVAGAPRLDCLRVLQLLHVPARTGDGVSPVRKLKSGERMLYAAVLADALWRLSNPEDAVREARHQIERLRGVRVKGRHESPDFAMLAEFRSDKEVGE